MTYENRLYLYPDFWPTDRIIDRDHLFIRDYLSTKFEDSRAKHSRVICCTGCWRPTCPLTLTFDLMTWTSIGIIYYLNTKFQAFWGQAFWSFLLHNDKEDRNTCAKQYATPSSKSGGINIDVSISVNKTLTFKQTPFSLHFFNPSSAYEACCLQDKTTFFV